MPIQLHIKGNHEQAEQQLLERGFHPSERLTHPVTYVPEGYEGDKALCPGCYMIALFDAAVELAKREGQPVQELGASMAELFTKLAEQGEYRATEEMIVRPTVVRDVPADSAYGKSF